MDLLEYVLTFIIGIITGVIGLYQFKNQQWGTIVSNSRNIWINDFRNEISIIVATLKMNPSYYSKIFDCEKMEHDDFLKAKKEAISIIYEAEKARARLLTKLNTSNVGNGACTFKLNNLLSLIDFCKPDQNQIDEIIELTKKILEPEWQKVKNEARGKKK